MIRKCIWQLTVEAIVFVSVFSQEELEARRPPRLVEMAFGFLCTIIRVQMQIAVCLCVRIIVHIVFAYFTLLLQRASPSSKNKRYLAV